MKFSKISNIVLPSLVTISSVAAQIQSINNPNNNINLNNVQIKAYTNTFNGEVQIPSDTPPDCVNLLKLYDYFNLGRPGFIVGEVMYNCCYYETRRLHSMDNYATTEWECENYSQAPNNHITSM